MLEIQFYLLIPPSTALVIDFLIYLPWTPTLHLRPSVGFFIALNRGYIHNYFLFPLLPFGYHL
ncbi:hypothetical protein BJX62DRAFT_209302 [Aspergillus germanicus]